MEENETSYPAPPLVWCPGPINLKTENQAATWSSVLRLDGLGGRGPQRILCGRSDHYCLWSGLARRKLVHSKVIPFRI